MDACKTAQASTPQETKQHRLGLIVLGVADGNRLASACLGVGLKGRVAGIARVALLGGARLNVHAQCLARDAEGLGTSHRLEALERSLGTQLMIDRRCLQRDVEALAERVKRVEQRRRIWPARERNKHAIALRHKGTATHGLEDGGDEHAVHSVFADSLRYHRRVTSTRDPIAQGTRLLVAALATASLGFGGEFAGCGGPGTPPSGPVPEGPPVQCLADGDCTALMCQEVQCIASRCVSREATRVDLDGDGMSPLPCGSDCDDTNPSSLPGAPEVCDLRDNDCDERVDEGAEARFITGELPVQTLASAPMLIDGVPGLLFLSSSADRRALEVRWLGTESALVGIASIAEASVGLAAARSLGGGRAEILWTTRTAPVALHRATLRVAVGASISMTIERSEVVMTLPNVPTALRMQGDERGSAILVAADPTLLLLPDLAPIPVDVSTFDIALAGDVIAIPTGFGPVLVNFYDRPTGVLRGTFTPESALDHVERWGERLFLVHAPSVTEIDTETLEPVRTLNIGTTSPTFWGSTSTELVFLDAFSQRVAGIDELGVSEHAHVPFVGAHNQLFELGTRLVVVSNNPENTIYQIEECGR